MLSKRSIPDIYDSVEVDNPYGSQVHHVAPCRCDCAFCSGPWSLLDQREGLKRVFQTNQRNYVKDLDFSFHPFLPILGTGLVTAQGQLWQQQRLLMAPTLRVDVLDDVVSFQM